MVFIINMRYVTRVARDSDFRIFNRETDTEHSEVQAATGPQDVLNLRGNSVKRILPRDNNDREERIASRDNT